MSKAARLSEAGRRPVGPRPPARQLISVRTQWQPAVRPVIITGHDHPRMGDVLTQWQAMIAPALCMITLLMLSPAPLCPHDQSGPMIQLHGVISVRLTA